MKKFNRRKRKAILKKGSGLKVLQNIKRAKLPYYIDHNAQGTTVIIETPIFKQMFTDGSVPRRELWFISQVKAEVMRRHAEGLFFYEPLTNYKPNFFKFKKPNTDFFTNVVELDINAAYWHTLFFTGAISKELFDKGFKVSKMARLCAVGTLGKQTFTYYFDGNKLHKEAQKVSPMREFWKTIVNSADNVINEVFMQLDSVLFYWVDAIFINENEAPRAVELFRQLGYEVKAKPLEYILFTGDTYIVQEANKPEPKLFTLPKTQQHFLNYFKKQF